MAAIVQGIVAITVMLFFCSGSKADSNEALSCVENQVLKAPVTAPGSTLKLQCPTGYSVTPDCSPSVGEVFCDENCTDKKNVADLCPGASGTQEEGADQPIMLSFPQLPQNTTTFYLKCTKSSQWCKFAVTVSGVSPEGPQVCAVKDTSVSLEVKGDGGSTQFACGDDLPLNPKSVTKAYDEDCTKEKDLKDLTRSPGSGKYLILKATKTPRDQKLCYLCGTGKGKGTENCAVLITVSAGSGFAARSAFGLALPCVLALLHFT